MGRADDQGMPKAEWVHTLRQLEGQVKNMEGEMWTSSRGHDEVSKRMLTTCLYCNKTRASSLLRHQIEVAASLRRSEKDIVNKCHAVMSSGAEGDAAS